jgi:hypothetical protein
MQALTEILKDLQTASFYGSLELKFEAGRVVLVRKTETLKPASDNCRDNRGKPDERKSIR